MGLISSIFTWWNGATAGTYWTTWRHGNFVGEDGQGNRYYRDSGTPQRRWVVYKGLAEPSRVPPEWHHWLHHTGENPPTEDPGPVAHAWEKPHIPNMTGTPYAYRPKGSLYSTGERPKATGDYEAWTPE